MSEQVIEVGDMVHIITRRLFDGDVRRHFLGRITGVAGNLQEVQGYAFVYQPGINEYKKRPELRSRVFSLGDVGLIVNKIPMEINIESLEYRVIEKRLVLTDNHGYSLDVDEFGQRG